VQRIFNFGEITNTSPTPGKEPNSLVYEAPE